MRFIMIGDIVGKPGRRVVQQQLPELRRRFNPDLIIANAENIAGGSGITPQLYHKLLAYGLDALTLGDHVYRQKDLLPLFPSLDRLSRPYNLPPQAVGRSHLRLLCPRSPRPLYIITLLGRIYMNTGGPLGDDPFAAADRFLAMIEKGAHVLVEIHAEATSEKVALGHYLDGRVAAVIGTHTHIPTADAKILPGGAAFISDLGMTGPYDSVLGRRKERVLQFMSTGMPAPFDVAEGDVRLCGVRVDLDDSGRAIHIERIELPADPDRPPFTDPHDDM
jgi:hypothetical protein